MPWENDSSNAGLENAAPHLPIEKSYVRPWKTLQLALF